MHNVTFPVEFIASSGRVLAFMCNVTAQVLDLYTTSVCVCVCDTQIFTNHTCDHTHTFKTVAQQTTDSHVKTKISLYQIVICQSFSISRAGDLLQCVNVVCVFCACSVAVRLTSLEAALSLPIKSACVKGLLLIPLHQSLKTAGPDLLLQHLLHGTAMLPRSRTHAH